LVDGETIAAVLHPGSPLLSFDLEEDVDAVVDAAGKYLIPGGIDPHTIWNCPSAARRLLTLSQYVQ
jgi:dihydropyrimidinase